MNCQHEKTVCPNHAGGFDCTPFRDFCEAEQEYCRVCNALEIVLADLEYNNNHTLGKLLVWAYREETLTNEQALKTYKAWLLAKDFLYYGESRGQAEEINSYQSWLEMPERKTNAN